MRAIGFATSNKNKLEEVRRVLGIRVRHVRSDAVEIQSDSVAEVARQKAIQAYRSVRKGWVIAEDTGLCLKALHGLPGPMVKWWIKAIGAEGICSLLNGVSRDAYAETCICLYNGRKFRMFSGRVHGKITGAPKGRRDFDWDCIFKPSGHRLTFAEMTIDEKNRISHRGKALRKLKRFLEKA